MPPVRSRRLWLRNGCRGARDQRWPLAALQSSPTGCILATRPCTIALLYASAGCPAPCSLTTREPDQGAPCDLAGMAACFRPALRGGVTEHMPASTSTRCPGTASRAAAFGRVARGPHCSRGGPCRDRRTDFNLWVGELPEDQISPIGVVPGIRTLATPRLSAERVGFRTSSPSLRRAQWHAARPMACSPAQCW